MRERRRDVLSLMGAVVGAALLVAAIDKLTNSIDTTAFSWDLRYYIDMARRGLVSPLASPFAYRYLTPLLVRMISGIWHLPVEAGFGILARMAAVLQLVSVFLLAKWYSRSVAGAWVAMLATAFSFYQVKFLLFDTFRPDHLAYALLILQVYLGLRGKFWLLWLVTLVACQVREFNALPLVAWALVTLWEARQSFKSSGGRAAIVQSLIAALGLSVALLLPRLLIPVAEDFQFATLTRDGLLRSLLAPLILARDANFIYSLLAYALPLLMLASSMQLQALWIDTPGWDRRFLVTYSGLVLVLSFLGGTDFGRFATFLLPVLVLILARLAVGSGRYRVLGMLAAVFVFNRIWLPVPDASVDAYLDFYGAYGTRFNLASWVRIGELAALVVAGILIRRADGSGGSASAPLTG
ncbi:MAG TPA: hypothetical protein VFH29_06655 [Anaerolineales bacterium]|nr:hypothetical protein [Anaerolineales bacterium]